MIARSAIGSLKQAILATCVAMPLMICALLVNLKRGPWLGVLVGCVCFACFYSRKLIAPLAAAAICAAVVVTPIRERILDSYEHFTISGGRSTIWRIGAELVSEYPLGIGYHNSGILREFSPEIPPELKHFHNNLLNIAAETGWLGVFVFIWLIAAIVKTCFSNRNKPLYVALGCAVISWQCAGLVEYNFGDSEVTILAWMLLGLILKQGTTSPA
jgi:O-antigen ligase